LPAHTHTGTTASNGAHTHDVNNLYSVGGGGTPYRVTATDSNGTGQFNTSSNGAHTHTFTTDSTGTGSSFDIRPKYYELAFIMKL
jgi:hypothetical protein